MSAADVCRERGWVVGDVLVASSGAAYEVTAIGREKVLGVSLGAFGDRWCAWPPRGERRVWLDSGEAWTKATPEQLAAIRQRDESAPETAEDRTKPTQAKASLRRLEKAGVIRWWPDLEIVWALEAADHQARGPKAWVAVENVVGVLPAEVRDAFSAHYSHRVPDAPPPTNRDTLSARVSTQDTGYREQDTGHRGRAEARGCERQSKPTPPKTRADVEADLREQAANVVERIRWGEVPMPTPPGRRDALGFPSLNPERLLERLREGATADEVVATFGRLSARITSGELPPEFWGGLALTGYYAPLRDGLPIPGKSKPGLAPNSGPQIETAEEALAWAREHGNRMPVGWEWGEDGRGGVFARRSRAGGAA